MKTGVRSVVAILLLTLSMAANAAIIRVSTAGNDANDGSTWSLAKKTIQSAMTQATADDEIWVAQGTYTGDIFLKYGSSIYGGFAGSETVRTDRFPKSNVTILNGYINYISYGSKPGLIDGFTFQNRPAADGCAVYCNSGTLMISNNIFKNNGGQTTDYTKSVIYCRGCHVTIESNEFYNNKVSDVSTHGGSAVVENNIMDGLAGAIISDDDVSITISGNTIKNFSRAIDLNSVDSSTITGNDITLCQDGIWAIHSKASIKNNTIQNNLKYGISVISTAESTIDGNLIADNGSGINVSGSAITVTNNTICRNIGTNYTSVGGIGLRTETGPQSVISHNYISDNTGRGYGGGILAYNCLISNNTVVRNTIVKDYTFTPGGPPPTPYATGGGIYCLVGIVTNNTVCDNYSEMNNGGIWVSGTARNNIVAFNKSESGNICTYSNTDHNCFYNNTNEPNVPTGNISSNPMFVDRTSGDYHLSFISPCINAGGDASNSGQTDMDGQDRVIGGIIDIGADEVLPVALNINNAKLSIEGDPVVLTGFTITAASPNFFYIEDATKPIGIRVNKDSHGLSIGAKVDVEGTISVNQDGELVVVATKAEQKGSGTVPKPLGLTNCALGGGTFCSQQGIAQVSGLNNIGLLVKTWGKVVEVDPQGTWFTISDGSKTTVKCLLPTGVTLQPDTKYVAVTGISSCEKVEIELHQLLLIRTLTDIQVLK